MSNEGLGKMLVKSLILTTVPIGVALLMQRPELRQRLVMRSTFYARKACQVQADFWQDMALKCSTAYNKARMLRADSVIQSSAALESLSGKRSKVLTMLRAYPAGQ